MLAFPQRSYGQRNGPMAPTICPFCSQHSLTVKHVFFVKCPSFHEERIRFITACRSHNPNLAAILGPDLITDEVVAFLTNIQLLNFVYSQVILIICIFWYCYYYFLPEHFADCN